MPRTKSNKWTPTKARVTSYNSPSDTTTGTNTSSNTEITPSTSVIDTADYLRMTDAINRIFKKQILATMTGKDAILRVVRDCVIRNNKERLKDKRLYIHSICRDTCVKHGCLCIDERIAIPKAVKNAVLEDIHFFHPGRSAVLSLAQNIWWPYAHRYILAKAKPAWKLVRTKNRDSAKQMFTLT